MCVHGSRFHLIFSPLHSIFSSFFHWLYTFMLLKWEFHLRLPSSQCESEWCRHFQMKSHKIDELKKRGTLCNICTQAHPNAIKPNIQNVYKCNIVCVAFVSLSLDLYCGSGTLSTTCNDSPNRCVHSVNIIRGWMLWNCISVIDLSNTNTNLPIYRKTKIPIIKMVSALSYFFVSSKQDNSPI